MFTPVGNIQSKQSSILLIAGVAYVEDKEINIF